MIKKWELKAPVCKTCNKQDKWEARVENLKTGLVYFVCSCGGEQNEKDSQKNAYESRDELIAGHQKHNLNGDEL